ncbi:methyl-accepting chemotaxis protein [Paraglaciecola sp.]|uniref:methyl-accepting chemotaxis protein n=1 Tax=Paraglaciecola sp. TaxID=1920173 RepID=UPI0032647EDC
MKRWLSKHLSKLTLIPSLVLVIFMSLELTREYHQFEQAQDNVADAELTKFTSQLVHELQKERGMSAGYIGSKGSNFKSELQQQRQLTDKSLQALKNFYQEGNYHTSTNQTISQLITNLSQLLNTRSKINSLTISLPDALAFYTNNNKLILDLNGILAAELEETKSAERFLTLYNLAYAKEQAGIERAVLSNVFSQDAFTPQLFLKFAELISKQDVYIQSAYAVSTADFKIEIEQFINAKANKDVERYREIARKNQNNFGVNPTEWFSTATVRLNTLRNSEQVLLDEISSYSKSKIAGERFFIIAELVILLLMLLVTYAVFSTIKLRASQSNEINRIMNKVHSQKDLTDSIQVISEDELGAIASLINQTFLEIKQDLMSFQEAANQITSATNEAAAATNQSQTNLTQLQREISDIANSTEEMSDSVKSVMENMHVASTGAENAAKETVNGEKAVETSISGITVTAKEVANVGETITELNNRVNDILGMVDVIKSVADQTNLLALNAAIEAARAGEQGRGFAVVADEVRSLAKRTQQSTQEISDVVDVLKQSSEKAFSSIESGNKQAKEAVSNANQISSVLAKIVENCQSVDKVTQTISVSTKEQNIVIQSINKNISSIETQARENVVGAEQLSASSLQLSSVAQDMSRRIEVYKV